MRSSIKLLTVLAAFSALFFCLRLYGNYIGYNVMLFVSDLGGLTYLYSTVGMMFAVFAGFVIISESQDWNALNAAANGEVSGLNELFLWSRRLPKAIAERFSNAIQKYLEIVIRDEWTALQHGIKNVAADEAIDEFHVLIADASRYNPDVADRLFASFSDFLDNRATRVRLSWQPLPSILKFTVLLVDLSVICLSLFIGVKNPWLDYIFMICIVTLGFVVLFVIDDLDNPLRPGEWFLTNESYKRLLKRLRLVK